MCLWIVRLCDADSELEQLAANTFSPPSAVLKSHAANEGEGVLVDTMYRRFASLGAEVPEEPESLPMPPQDRFGPEEQHGASPARDQGRDRDQQGTLMHPDLRASHGPRGHDELLTEHGVLGDEFGFRPREVGDQPADHALLWTAHFPERGPRASEQRRCLMPDSSEQDANHDAI